MKQKKRAQAALEFLTTYGWALMGVMGVIAVLVYMGFGDVTNNVPTQCNFGPGFSCNAFYGTQEGNFAMELTNMQRTAINITELECAFGEPDLKLNKDLVDQRIAVGEKFILFCNSSGLSNPSFSGKERFYAKLYYEFDEQDALKKTITGELIIAVADDDTALETYVNRAVPYN